MIKKLYVLLMGLLAFICAFLLAIQDVDAKDKEITVNFGTGVFQSGKNSLAESKYLSLGVNNLFYQRRLFYRYEVGLYTDSAGNGRHGSGFGFGMLGVNVENSVFYAQGGFGAGIIARPDAYLGGSLQFTEEVNLGLTGPGLTKLGMFFKHISSAGIYEPNMGRDMLGIRVSIPF